MRKLKRKLLVCKICEGEFLTLATHIIRIHRITVGEYLNRFPGAKLTTSEYRENLSRSAKTRFVEHPELRKIVAARTFDFIENSDLRNLLSRDYKTAKECLFNELWKPSIILYGALIEAILRENTKEKTFHSALEKSLKNQVISEIEFHQIHIVKNSRNFVHLHKELDEKVNVINDYWAKTLSDICESLIRKFRQSQHPVLTTASEQ